MDSEDQRKAKLTQPAGKDIAKIKDMEEKDMTYASEDLRTEHVAIMQGLDILEQMVKALKKKGTLDTLDTNDMMNFLHLFADKCHNGKEEGIMFPAMETAGISSEKGLIGQLLHEHTQGRQFVANIGASVQNGALNQAEFAEAATAYISLMRTHIKKENDVLFPMGDKALPSKEQAQLLTQFEIFEEEVIGEGVHERLHETLHRLEKKYLSDK